MMSRSRRADLRTLARYAGQGKVRPVTERIYPRESLGEAHRAVETGHARGKKVMAVASG
ncbi:zinc-binding dehydrogenase [Nonomuraea sp. NPDC049695]|uniref:zinc-binding dehydrogenase n=1 Tax=Nonomuraea sp. NPDC049695 TaxID=3154734 RepID=UPI00343623D7